MPEKKYLILLDVDARKRHYHFTEAGRITNYEDALTFADDDINENYEIYKEKFLRGEFP